MLGLVLAVTLTQSQGYPPYSAPDYPDYLGEYVARPRAFRSSGRPGRWSSAGAPDFEFAPLDGRGMGTECACSAVTGTRGETITVARASVGECLSADGQTLTQCAANQPRVSTWDEASSQLGLLAEGIAATNQVTYGSDLSDASWTTYAMTCTMTSVGLRGGSNTASQCASAGAGTAIYTTALGSAEYSGSLYLRRVTGSGDVSVTLDNGSTWTAVSGLDSTWKRVVPVDTYGCTPNCIVVPAMKATLASPAIGLKVTDPGDVVDVDFVQLEANNYASSPIATDGATATRASEVVDADVVRPAGFYASGSMSLDYFHNWPAGAYGGFLDLASYNLSFCKINAVRLYANGGLIVNTGAPHDGAFHTYTYWGTESKIFFEGALYTGTPVVATTAVTRLGIGWFLNHGFPSNIVVKNVCVDNKSGGCR